MDDDRDDIQRHSADSPGDAADPLWNGEHPRVDSLSAYLSDPDAFEPEARAAIEGHLATCTECVPALDDLRTLVTALATLPEPAAPRSFALTPELLAEHDVPVALEARRLSPRRERQLAFVRWATAVAAVLFVAVLGADAISNAYGSSSGESAASAAPVSIQAFSASTEPAEDSSRNAATAEQSEPPQSSNGSASQPTEAITVANVTPATAGGAEAGATPPELSANADQATEEPVTSTLSAPSPELASVTVETTEHDDRWGWETLELALALLLTWLLAAIVVLPRLGSSAERGN